MHSRTHSQAVFRNIPRLASSSAITSRIAGRFPRPRLLPLVAHPRRAPRLKNESHAVPFAYTRLIDISYILGPGVHSPMHVPRLANIGSRKTAPVPCQKPSYDRSRTLRKGNAGGRPTRLADMCFRRPKSRILELELNVLRATSVKPRALLAGLPRVSQRASNSSPKICPLSRALPRKGSFAFVTSSIVRPRESRESLEATAKSLSVCPAGWFAAPLLEFAPCARGSFHPPSIGRYSLWPLARRSAPLLPSSSLF